MKKSSNNLALISLESTDRAVSFAATLLAGVRTAFARFRPTAFPTRVELDCFLRSQLPMHIGWGTGQAKRTRFAFAQFGCPPQVGCCGNNRY